MCFNRLTMVESLLSDYYRPEAVLQVETRNQSSGLSSKMVQL